MPRDFLSWDATNAFHRVFYNAGSAGGTWRAGKWFGVEVQKYPTDLMVYQEIIHEVRPSVIIETGTYAGGSALFFAHMLGLLQVDGIVVSIDNSLSERPEHNRIRYKFGSSIDEGVVRHVHDMTNGLRPGGGHVMVVLDSNHACEHVAEELRLYSPLVTVGSYLVVEDTNLNGNPVWPEHGPGPKEALDAFLLQSKSFMSDWGREKFLLTANPGGWLRRVS